MVKWLRQAWCRYPPPLLFTANDCLDIGIALGSPVSLDYLRKRRSSLTAPSSRCTWSTSQRRNDSCLRRLRWCLKTPKVSPFSVRKVCELSPPAGIFGARGGCPKGGGPSGPGLEWRYPLTARKTSACSLQRRANIPDFWRRPITGISEPGQLQVLLGSFAEGISAERGRRFHSQVEDDAAHSVHHCGAVQLRLAWPG